MSPQSPDVATTSRNIDLNLGPRQASWGSVFWGLQLLPFEVCKLLVVVVVVVVVVVFMGFLFVYLTYCHVYDLFVAISGRVFVKARVQ